MEPVTSTDSSFLAASPPIALKCGDDFRIIHVHPSILAAYQL
jgi:hypothetical protein